MKLIYYPPDFVWPEGVARTPRPLAVWPYRINFDRALKELKSEITRWIPPSGDADLGMERGRTVDDHGVVVRFGLRDGRTFCAACDRYQSRMANARALTLFMQALRRMERDGCQQLLEQMASGQMFTALAPPAKWPWSELGMTQQPRNRAELDQAYRARAQEVHPDRGGTAVRMARLNHARDDALDRMGWR